MKSSRGFSLIETLIAIAIIAVISVAVLIGLSTAASANIISDEKTTAGSIARSQIEYIQKQPYQTSNPPSYYSIVGMVAGITISNAGTGYIVGDAITVAGGTGTGFTGSVASIGTGGTVTGITITVAGTGYADDDAVSVTSGIGSGFTGVVAVYNIPDGYSIVEPMVVRLDPENDGTGNDDGLQQIIVTVMHGTKTVLTLEDYKVSE
ncbi:MAG: prepilin-type N-terminal cleavage/methylation domain-containing protein [Dehalococcoidales bacterium]|nr:prepilin-type N-terminal cleavage/methylation domain-containing protein [Dehalococcoidales bacterium]